MHSTKPPGINCIDVTKGGSLILTGGVDKNVQVYDRTSGKTLATLKGHGKPVTAVAFVDPVAADAEGLPQLLVSASQDKTIRLWTPIDAKSRSKQAYSAGATISIHTDEVTALAVHPCRSILASASLDGSWALHDLEDPASPQTLLTGQLDADIGGTSFAFHPDGVIFAVGTSAGTIAVYDTASGKLAHTYAAPTGTGAVTSLSFSENGYLLASASSHPGASTNIWDLRKLKLVESLAAASETAVVRSVAWDPSAQFLAEAGSALRIYQNKVWGAPLLNFEDNTAELTGVAWAGKAVVLGGLDRSLRILGQAA
jgi:pre-mRNA-processing factor 19